MIQSYAKALRRNLVNYQSLANTQATQEGSIRAHMAMLWQQRELEKKALKLYNIIIIFMIPKSYCNHVSIIYA
jgi:hypothetical protein